MHKNSSDEEFWDQIEKPIYLPKPKKIYDRSDFFNIVTDPNNSFCIKPSGKLERLVENLRLSMQEELQAQSIIIRNKTIREIQIRTDDIKKKYEDEVATIIKENIMLRENCISLKIKLEKLCVNCMDQEMLLALMRVSQIPEAKPVVEVHDYSEELKAVNGQLKLSKDIIRLYMDKLDQNTETIDKLRKEIEDIKARHELAIGDLNNIRSEMEKHFIAKIGAITEDFGKYKQDTSTEINLHSVINKKQSHTVSLLKDEIKRAQVILQSPRLRKKTEEKYQEILSTDKSMKTDRSYRHKSIMLPQLSSDKEVFSNTKLPLSKNSSLYSGIMGSRK